MAYALARTRQARIPPARLCAFFADAMVVPVLTAHPTEVRRKSTIDREMEVADLLTERDQPSLTVAELGANEAALRRAVLTLWHTNLLRRTRLRVIDEVANGLSYYDYTFLSELPRFYAALEGELASAGVALADRLPSFLRIGSWIAGDRDGNPFVTEEVLRAALRSQSSRALKYYLDELHLLGGELSLDRRLVGVSMRSRSWPPARPTAPPTDRTSRTGARSPGSTRGWRRRHGCSITSKPRNTPSATRHPVAAAASCSPISRSSTARSSPTARGSWPRAA